MQSRINQDMRRESILVACSTCSPRRPNLSKRMCRPVWASGGTVRWARHATHRSGPLPRSPLNAPFPSSSLSLPLQPPHTLPPRFPSRRVADVSRRSALAAVSGLTESLVDTVNSGVVEVFETQKRIEEEARELQGKSAKFARHDQKPCHKPYALSPKP